MTDVFVCVFRDLRKFKESKKQFDKVSEEKEAALIKNAQAPRNKQHEVEEANSILSATRKCFRHIVLDYVLQVNTHLQHAGIQDEHFIVVLVTRYGRGDCKG